MEESIPVSENQVDCPFCNNKIEAKAFYCPVCGKKVREKPLSTSFGPVFLIFFLCVFLPPFNIGKTIKYMRSPDPKAKKIGLISLAVMFITLIGYGIITYITTTYVMNEVNRQVGESLKMYGL
jgi:hypothetical protein